jgi:hypothetical protein
LPSPRRRNGKFVRQDGRVHRLAETAIAGVD